MSDAMKAVGISSDGRTIVWRITPPCCGKSFTPSTTRLSWQIVECPACGKQWAADYNAMTLEDLA